MSARPRSRRIGVPAVLGPWLLATVVSTTTASTARANDPAAAESLFREAQGLLAHGDVAGACPKLEESQRLDPTGATALSLARCLDKLGKTASAWARYQESLEFARKKGARAREKEISERIAEITPTVPRLVIDVPSRIAATPGLRVSRDGTVVGSAQWNSEIAVDPGTVRISASAPGRLDWAREVSLGPGEIRRVDVPDLAEIAAAPPAPLASSASPVTSAPVPAPSPPVAAAPPPRSKVLGFSTLGLGVVAIGVGTYFLVRHGTLADEATSLCSSSTCGKDGHDAAVTKSDQSAQAGTLAVVGFGAGAGLFALGAYLVLRSESTGVAMTPWLGPSAAGATVGGRF